MLADLGLLPALRAMAIETSALVFANRHGQTIYRDARGLDGGYSQPQLSIHSALRRQFYPSEGAPRWNRMMMWRGTSVPRPFLDGRTMVQADHRRAKIVEMNRREGLDAVLDMVEERAPDGFAQLQDVIDPAEVAAFVQRYKAATGHQHQHQQHQQQTA